MTITRAETEAAWAASGITRYTDSELSNLALPSSAKDSLREFGLPNEVDDLFSGCVLARSQVPKLGESVEFGRAWYGEYQMHILSSEGTVYAFHEEGRETTYANAGIAEFIEFLARAALVYQLYDRADAGDIDKKAYLGFVDETRMQLNRVDARALVDGNWWSRIVDEFTMI